MKKYENIIKGVGFFILGGAAAKAIYIIKEKREAAIENEQQD